VSADLQDFWFAQWPDPVRRPPSPDPTAVQFYTGEAAHEDVPIMSRWFEQWPDPVRRVRTGFPQTEKFEPENPYGMTLPETVHVNWYYQWPDPVRRKPFPVGEMQFLAIGLVPATPPAGLSVSVAAGSFAFGGGAVSFPGSPLDQPFFYWDQSYVIPLNAYVPGGQQYNPEFQFIAYDPINKVLWVQWTNGFARTYAPVNVGQVQAISFAVDDEQIADIIDTLPLVPVN
jgi:hypothetical protein